MIRRAIAAAMVLAFCLAATPAKKKRVVRYDLSLPVLGTKFHPLPAGDGKSIAEGACLPCHSAEMLVQQRLTEKQWTAAVEKMMRWGAVVTDEQKPKLVAYLAKHFGPENKFVQYKTRPVGY